MGKLIIIEGTDGSGKQTQATYLFNKLKELNIDTKQINFPNYESPMSMPVKIYLSGKLGDKASDINPYAASSFYSIDRYGSYRMEWKKEYEKGYTIISDRYTTANMIHQACKIEDIDEKDNFLDWLVDLEYNKFELPVPDLVIFLDVPFEYSSNLIKNRNNKITNEKEKDIHESDKEYLKNAYQTAKMVAKKYDWLVIDCIKNGNIRDIDDIHSEILENVINKVLKG